MLLPSGRSGSNGYDSITDKMVWDTDSGTSAAEPSAPNGARKLSCAVALLLIRPLLFTVFDQGHRFHVKRHVRGIFVLYCPSSLKDDNLTPPVMAAPISPAELQYYQEHASDSQQPNLIATIVLCLVLPIFAVGLRFFARWRMRAGYKADDWLILLALVRLQSHFFHLISFQTG